ncbi:MAG: hypothetical protein WBD22_09260 [Pyrinomonadaceae bacterium]
MKGKFEVSFNSPQCGWMSIGFDNGIQEFHTTTAHVPHEAALSNLLSILSSLMDTSSTENEYLLKWNRDPEEFDFHFVRSGGDLLIEIFQYPTEERDARERELVFTHTGPLFDVCRSFAETFEQLHEDRDTDEFESNWRQPFPSSEFEIFRNRLM